MQPFHFVGKLEGYVVTVRSYELFRLVIPPGSLNFLHAGQDKYLLLQIQVVQVLFLLQRSPFKLTDPAH